MRSLIVYFFAVLFFFEANAQSGVAFGLVVSPTISTFISQSKNAGFAPMYPINTGFKLNYHRQNFIFSSGILHQNHHSKFQFEHSTLSNPEGTSDFFWMIHRSKAVAVPVNIDYKLFDTEKLDLFIGIGLQSLFYYSREVENTMIEHHQQPANILNPPQRFTASEMFPKFNLATNFGIGLNYKLASNILLQFRPNVIYQETPEYFSSNSNSAVSYSFDIGIFYRI
jgi:hypothetical protein